MSLDPRINGSEFHTQSGVWLAKVRSGPEADQEGTTTSYTLVFSDPIGHTRKLILKIANRAPQNPTTQRRIVENIRTWLAGRAGYGVLLVPAAKISELAHDFSVKSTTIFEALMAVGARERRTEDSLLEWDEVEKVAAYFEARRNRELEDAVARMIGKPAIIDSHVQHRDTPNQSTPTSVATDSTVAPLGVTQSRDNGHPPIVARPDAMETRVLELPSSFSFTRRGFLDVENVLRHLQYHPGLKSLTVDLTRCESANFQALTLLIQYCWYLTLKGCSVTFKYGPSHSGPTNMLRKMEASDWREILLNDGADFGTAPSKQTFALRRRADVQNTINNARRAIGKYKIGFPEYLSYIVSELLYNATEHGRRLASVDNCQVLVPAIFQFGYYTALNRLAFIFSDLGIGIKAHLEQSYPPFATDQDAITYALRPNVSGTSRQQSGPYATNENAGMGLTYSSLMLKRLKGDMHIVSRGGVVHVSPEDVTSRKLTSPWPGTFVLINLNLGGTEEIPLEALLSEIRQSARKEIDGASEKERCSRYLVNVFNYFGKWAEDKDAAITFRDRHILPAVEAGKKIDLDFRDVETAPHSFLNALLATPIKRLGPRAYQWIRIYNAPGSIHEIIDKVLEDNLPKIG